MKKQLREKEKKNNALTDKKNWPKKIIVRKK